MNKKKNALLSTIVFLSVFCLSAIFNIPTSWITMKSQETKTEEASTVLADASAPADADHIEIFSYSTTVPPENTLNGPTENIAETAEIDLKQSKAGNTGEITAATPNPIESPKADDPQGETNADDTEEPPKDEVEEQEQEPSLYADMGISIADDFVNIRSEASTESEILGKLYKDSAAKILKTKGEWYYVESGSVKGYVKTEFIKTGIPDNELIEKYGERSVQVDTDGLNVRKTRDKESDKLDVIYRNEVYPVLETDDEWVKIKITDDNITGYVMREYIDLIVQFKKAVSKEEEAELLQLQAEEKAKEETAIKQQEGVDYNVDDLMLLACLVHAEAGTQTYEGKLAVANVVLNRIKSSKYPDSMKAVIYQPGQFSVARSGSLAKQLANYDHYNSWAQKLSIKAAKAALNGSNNIGSRLYFHSYKAAVHKGYDDRENAVKIDDQLFW